MDVEPFIGKAKRSIELAEHRINVWEGSVRSGKTVASLVAWLLFVRSGPAGNLVMIGKTERTLKRNCIDPLVDMLGPKRCRYVAGSGELWIQGRRIYVAGANDVAAEGKIRGLTLAGAYVDEASLMPEGMWSMLRTRLSIDGAQMFATTNPDNPRHWLMRDWLKKAAVWLQHDGTVTYGGADSIDLGRFSFNMADNPHLPPGYIEDLKASYTGLWRRRFIDGAWVLAEGAIYDMFDPTVAAGFVVTEVPDCVVWHLAADYGTTNPFAALLLGVGVDRRIYVAREWRWDSREKRRQRTDAEYSAELRTWLTGLELPDRIDGPVLSGASQPERFDVDPSAASFIAQLWRDGWSGVHRADNRVADGLRAVATLFASGRLLIHESCTALIDELGGYVWDPKAAERGVEQPLKVDDHSVDALRYGVAGLRRWWRNWATVEGFGTETDE